MRITPRHLVVLNGLTVLTCVLHVLVHAADLNVGEWHDYGVYALVAVSFVASLLLGRQAQREPCVDVEPDAFVTGRSRQPGRAFARGAAAAVPTVLVLNGGSHDAAGRSRSTW